MKIIAISDMHGDLDNFVVEPCDVVCICGDIVPLHIQCDFDLSCKWLTNKFFPWCAELKCDKVILIAGNHDFVFQDLNDLYKHNRDENKPTVYDFIRRMTSMPDKVVYLQDSLYEYKGITFYGTPWIPELRRWAFYKSSDDLFDVFGLIPDSVDVLLTHSPGKFVNDTGVSLQYKDKPEYGSMELTNAVNERHIKYWFVGHVHSGNHKFEKYGDTMVANVSLKDEDYRTSYKPLIVEIEDGETVC